MLHRYSFTVCYYSFTELQRQSQEDGTKLWALAAKFEQDQLSSAANKDDYVRKIQSKIVKLRQIIATPSAPPTLPLSGCIAGCETGRDSGGASAYPQQVFQQVLGSDLFAAFARKYI